MDKGHTENETRAFGISSDDQLFVFVQKKTGKAVSAVYIVTDLLSDREAIKWTLRRVCIELLEDSMLFMRKGFSSSRATDLRSRISEIITLFEIASSSRLLSEMNTKLLHSVFDELSELFGEIEKKTQLQSHMFEVSDIPEQLSIVSDDMKSYETSSNLYDMSFKKDVPVLKDKSSEEADGNNQGVSREAADRKKHIISVLKDRRIATINDIKKSVDGVSDKTLQRDLSSLVQENVLKRNGTRRWTTYSLM